jgi:hypothetical protein
LTTTSSSERAITRAQDYRTRRCTPCGRRASVLRGRPPTSPWSLAATTAAPLLAQKHCVTRACVVSWSGAPTQIRLLLVEEGWRC